MGRSMQTVHTIRDLRTMLLPWREKGETVGLIPTMGALHKGHISLVDAARKIVTRTVASVFVNPMQFGQNEDLGKYPRALESDFEMLEAAGCDLLYAPNLKEVYPEGFVTHIDPGPLAKILEGEFRLGHFNGVATVVVKLLLQAMPDVAFFGEKDYQQLLIIRRVVRDLNIPVHVLSGPLIRDQDGLALSSRNAYLTAEQRKHAVMLPKTLLEAAQRMTAGENIDLVVKDARTKLVGAGFKCDYFELRDAGTLAPVHDLTLPARLLVAARIGQVRLIDNVAVSGA